MITTWHETPHDLFDEFPNVEGVSRGVAGREVRRRAIERHNTAIGFDETLVSMRCKPRARQA